jgi:DUF1680 family protein
VFNWEVCTCCSGSYFQDVADFHNILYYREDEGIYVNMYVPSEVTWTYRGAAVRLTQETRYPDDSVSAITVHVEKTTPFAIYFRIPAWTKDATLRLNGVALPIATTPGDWATIKRPWSDGDRVEITIPLAMRMQAVDAQHPDRVALMRGPLALVLEGSYHDPNFRLPSSDAELDKWIVAEPWRKPSGILARMDPPPTERATVYRVTPPDGSRVGQRFRAMYDVGENYPYFMYFDRQALPVKLW